MNLAETLGTLYGVPAETTLENDKLALDVAASKLISRGIKADQAMPMPTPSDNTQVSTTTASKKKKKIAAGLPPSSMGSMPGNGPSTGQPPGRMGSMPSPRPGSGQPPGRLGSLRLEKKDEPKKKKKLKAGGPGSGRHPGLRVNRTSPLMKRARSMAKMQGPDARFKGNKQAVKEAHDKLTQRGYRYRRTDSASEGRAVNHKYVNDKTLKSAEIYEHNGGSVSIHSNLRGLNSSIEAREFSKDKRSSLAKKGKALPDGSFPIANTEDLKNAKRAIGRSKNPGKAKAFINKRAKQLGAPKIGASEVFKSPDTNTVMGKKKKK